MKYNTYPNPNTFLLYLNPPCKFILENLLHPIYFSGFIIGKILINAVVELLLLQT